MNQRLHKILAQSTKLSRRAAERAIATGEVTVNGKIVNKLGTLADPYIDIIKWKGVVVRPPREEFYIMYNKPKGRLVTKNDELKRPTIWSDLRDLKDRVNAVGRLDFNSEGLLVLTNNGELLNRLTHPKYKVSKVYNVKVRGFPTEEGLAEVRAGIKYHGVSYMPAQVRIVNKTDKHTWLDIKIAEGKNHEIRNIFTAIGNPVLKLRRVELGPLRLGTLPIAKSRFLRKKEIEELFQLVGLRFFGRGRF